MCMCVCVCVREREREREREGKKKLCSWRFFLKVFKCYRGFTWSRPTGSIIPFEYDF